MPSLREDLLPQNRQRTTLDRDALPRPAGARPTPQLLLVASEGQRVSNPERDQLLVENQTLVRKIAAALRDSISGYTNLDDLIDAGIQGLLYAVDHYDPAYGVTFQQYARHRIRGAILNSRSDWYRQRGRHGPPLNELPWRHHPSTTTNVRQIEIRQAIGRLPQRQQRLIWLYYAVGLTMDEIGLKLNVKKARVCHLHREAVDALRVILK